MFPVNDTRTYLSTDRLLEDDRGEDYSLEFIKNLDGGSSSFPDHVLTLKKGCIIMLLRNLDPAKGHCNGTRYIVRQLNRFTIEAVVATGAYRGGLILIPRLKFITGEDYPFQFSRTQFPVRLAFGITANKSQGQTYKTIGVCLHQPFFTHGQLYVALSRVGRSEDVIISAGENGQGDGHTSNIVYGQVLRYGGIV